MSQTVVFHGASHRVGCTMTAQSVAELIAKEKKELTVLFAALNGRKSTEYIVESIASIDDFKIQLKSGIGVDKGMLRPNRKIDNLYMIAGVCREEEARHYFPEMAETLVKPLDGKFDLVIIDSGSDLDNGLALGALKMNCAKYLVVEQVESSVKRYEKMADIYGKLGISFSKILLSKCIEGDPFTTSYISARIAASKSMFMEVGYSDKGRVSEMEGRTLLETGNDKYRGDIIKIANGIVKEMGIDGIRPKRRRTWNSFI